MKEITAQEVVQDIIDKEGLDTKSRKRILTYRRQYLMWFLRQVTNTSTVEIGKMFNRDHSTVIHACINVDYCVTAKDMFFLSHVADIKNMLDEYGFSKPKYKFDGQRVLTLFLSRADYKDILDMSEERGETISNFVIRCIRANKDLTNNE